MKSGKGKHQKELTNQESPGALGEKEHCKRLRIFGADTKKELEKKEKKEVTLEERESFLQPSPIAKTSPKV